MSLEESDLSVLLLALSAEQAAEWRSKHVPKHTQLDCLGIVEQARRTRLLVAERKRRKALKVWRKGGWHSPKHPEVPSTAYNRVYNELLIRQIGGVVSILAADQRQT